MERWVCAVRFPSLISHFAVLFFYITQFPLNIHPEWSDTKVAALFFFSLTPADCLKCGAALLLVWLRSAATMQNIWKDLLTGDLLWGKKYVHFFIHIFWITGMPTNTTSTKKKDNLAFLDGPAFSFYLQFFGAKQTLLIVGIRPPKSIYSTLKWS